MKNLKNLLAYLSMVLLLGSTGISATAAPLSTNPSSVQEQISDYLQGIDFTSADEEKTVLVDFMINDRNELMILSTNAGNMDKLIKLKLNYKKVKAIELERNKTYTLPIRFEKA